MIDAVAEIEDLVDAGDRAPGSDAERRAARHLARRLEDIGRSAEVESISIWPRWPLAHALHATLAVAGSAIAVKVPLAGFLVVLAATLSALVDLAGGIPVLRRLTGRRASQNVVSREDGGMPGRLILMAHYDAGSGGTLFNRMAERRAALAQRIGRPIGPFAPFTWSLLLVLLCALLRLVGVDASWLSAVQFVPTVVLIVCVPLLADVGLSSTVPGANDNASGVATVLRLAERYGGDLDHFDLWVVLPGAQEALMSGSRAWLRRHRRELAPERTIVLNVTTVGHGTIRYATREGYVLAYGYHPRLVALCEQIRAEDEEENRYGARPLRLGGSSDAHPARAARLPAISISCAGALDRAPDTHRRTDTPERIDEDALDRAFAFCSELIELIDEELGPRVAERAPSGELSEAG